MKFKKYALYFRVKKSVNKIRIFYFHYILYCEYKKKKKKWNMTWYDSSIFYFVPRHCDIGTAINLPRLDYTRNLCNERNARMTRIDLISVLRPQTSRSKYSDDFSREIQSRCCRPDTILRVFSRVCFCAFYVILIN